MFARWSFQNRRFRIALLCILLLVQCGLVFFYGEQKTNFFVDEYLTYTFANYKGGFLSDEDGFINSWQEGQKYHDALTVQPEERFHFNIALENNKKDDHPPIYHYILHFLSSLHPNSFSKWDGIIPNMLFCCMSTLMLYSLAAWMLNGNYAGALIVTIVWALSIGVISFAIFVRMYTLMAFFCIWQGRILMGALDELCREKFSIRVLTEFLVCTMLGVSSHYYFLIVSFFLCGSLWVLLLTQKRWSMLLQYTATGLVAILIASMLTAPNMIPQLFLGRQGSNVISNIKNADFSEMVIKGWHEIDTSVFNGLGAELLVLRRDLSRVFSS